MKKLLFLLLISLLFNCRQKQSKLFSREGITIEKQELVEFNKNTQTTYPIYYTQIKPDSIKSNFKLDSITVNQSIWLNNIQLITGIIDNNKNGIHLIVKDSLNNILFKSKGQQDSRRLNLYLFKSKENDRIIVISEIGDEESWGINIHELINEKYKNLGSLDIVATNEFEENLNIIPYLKIQQLDKDLLQFYFNEKIKIYDNNLEETYSGTNLKYEYSKTKPIWTKVP